MSSKTEKAAKTKPKNVILDRVRPAETQRLCEAKARLEDFEAKLAQARNAEKRAKQVVDEHAGKSAPQEDYPAKFRAAQVKTRKAQKEFDVVRTETEKVRQEITGLRAERAKVYQDTGKVRQAIAWRKSGMYQVSFQIGEGSNRISVTRHCRRRPKQGGDGYEYVARGGMIIGA